MKILPLKNDDFGANRDTGDVDDDGPSPPPEMAVSQLYREYQTYRVGLCVAEPKKNPALLKLVAALSPIPGVSKFLQAEAVATAVGRTLQMSRAVTRGAGSPMIAAWSQATASFGVETMRTLVTELNKTGMPAQQPPPGGPSQSSSRLLGGGVAKAKAPPLTAAAPASTRAITLEYAPAALNAAVKSQQWGSEVPALLAMFGWLFGETRCWLESKEGIDAVTVATATGDSGNDAGSLTYCVNINCFAMRDHVKYAAGIWGGSKGWMAEMTAIAAQRRRGAEISEERQRRQDKVLASLKAKLAVEGSGDTGGLLSLGGVGGALLNGEDTSVTAAAAEAEATIAAEAEETGGRPRPHSSIGGAGGGSPKGKKPRTLPALGVLGVGSSGGDMSMDLATVMVRELEQQVKLLQKQLQEQKTVYDVAFKMMNFVMKMMNFVLKMMIFGGRWFALG